MGAYTAIHGWTRHYISCKIKKKLSIILIESKYQPTPGQVKRFIIPMEIVFQFSKLQSVSQNLAEWL